jgi:hypothetical protein
MSQIFPRLVNPQEGIVEIGSPSELVAEGLLFINDYRLFTTVPVSPSGSM